MAWTVPTDMDYLLKAGAQKLFFDHFGRQVSNATYKAFTVTTKSNKASEDYPFMGEAPFLTEWKDSRQIKSLNPEQVYSLTNKKYEATIGVDRDAIDDDQYGQIQMRIRNLADNAARWFDEQAFETLEAGKSTECYDGQYYFDTDHVDPGASYSTSQSNDGSYSLTVANLKTVLQAMRKFKDGNGKPAGIRGTHLVVGPDNYYTAVEILKSIYYPSATNMGTSTTTDYVAVNKANALNGALQIIVDDWISDADGWGVLDLSHYLKPVIMQERRPLEFTSQTEGSDAGFMTERYSYGVSWRGRFGYTDWRLAYWNTP